MENQFNTEGLSCPAPRGATSDAESLAHSVGFELVGPVLGEDLERALQGALTGGAVFHGGSQPLSVFRQTLAASIRDIESHPRGKLFQDFLSKGPYEDVGEIPAALVRQRLSDAETAAAIRFIYSYMVNCFKGAVTELLAAEPCLNLLKRLQQDGELPADSRLYVGDTVRVHRSRGLGLLKGADLYILIEEGGLGAAAGVTVAGVAEVKSYFRSERRLLEQITQHIQRATRGLRVDGVDYPSGQVNVGRGRDRRVVRIAVLPSDWRLPRSFRFDKSESRRLLVDRPQPPRKDHEITRIGDNEWRVTLRWSKEALSEAAYEMTFWYMGKVGEVVFSNKARKGWEEMSPAEAGRNAAKMMLYYAILRCRSIREKQRAIALYNSYGFGFALGMSFRNADGRREMLWFRDLDEILSTGKTKSGCTLR